MHGEGLLRYSNGYLEQAVCVASIQRMELRQEPPEIESASLWKPSANQKEMDGTFQSQPFPV